MIVFVASVFVTGFTTKKINNISEPTYGKAFMAIGLGYGLTFVGLVSFEAFAA